MENPASNVPFGLSLICPLSAPAIVGVHENCRKVGVPPDISVRFVHPFSVTPIPVMRLVPLKEIIVSWFSPAVPGEYEITTGAGIVAGGATKLAMVAFTVA